jgi:hypothetical protein
MRSASKTVRGDLFQIHKRSDKMVEILGRARLGWEGQADDFS